MKYNSFMINYAVSGISELFFIATSFSMLGSPFSGSTTVP